MVYYSTKKPLKLRFFCLFRYINFFRENIKIYCWKRINKHNLLCLKKYYDKKQKICLKKLVDTCICNRI